MAVKSGDKEDASKETQKVDFVKWFSEINKDSGPVSGGKGANLGEMYNIGVPVPPGFIVTAQAYDYFIEKAGIKQKLIDLLEKIDYENTKELSEATSKVRELILNSKFPKEMEEEILESYDHLSASDTNLAEGSALDILNNAHENVFVAVRSSATTEDLADASFAGQQDTFVNVKGNQELIKNIKKCFASLFTARATYYRHKEGFKFEEAHLAVVVQKMIDSMKSGVIFSKDPSYKNDNTIIEAVWGLGEGIVSGKITPDKYVISKDMEIIDKKIEDKKIALTRSSSGETTVVKLKEEKSKQQVLKEGEIISLAKIALKLEDHYKKPQDIEFAIDDEIHIVQTRAITTIKNRISSDEIKDLKGEVILEGLAASPGIASGKVKIIKTLDDLDKIQTGDILVTEMTNPDMVVSMQKSAGIITDEEGLTAHAAIVSREMGIPCFSGQTKVLTNKGFMDLEKVNDKIINGETLLTLSFNKKTLKTEWKRILNTSKRTANTMKVSFSKSGKIEYNEIWTTAEHNFLKLNLNGAYYQKIIDIINGNGIVYAAEKISSINEGIFNFNEKLAYLCGAIFSDGYLRIQKDGTSSTVFIQKNIPEKYKFIEYVYDNFNQTMDYQLRTVNQDYHYCYNQSITRKFIEIKNNITNIILSSQKSAIISYLAGIIDGDGNYIKRGNCIKISLNSKDDKILHSLILSCLRLGLSYRLFREDNQYRFYILSDLDIFRGKLKRLNIDENYSKTTGEKYLSAKDLFESISLPGRKGIKSFVKNNCLISKEEIKKKVEPFLKETSQTKIGKIIKSDLSALRAKDCQETREEFVFNIEVEDNNNYVVFSRFYSPILVKNCVVGTQTATTTLKENEEVTIDAYTGKVYRGKIAETEKKEIEPVTAQTKTKIKLIVDLPTFAERASKTGIKAVGLTRIEGIIAESGKHPNYFIEKNAPKDYEEVIFKGIEGIAKYFDEIWVRTSDIRSDEFSNLEGAPKEKEANPMLGMHGIRFSIKHPLILKAELNALKRVSEQNKKIGILMPQIISVEEVQKVKQILKEIEFHNAKLGVMVETPAAVQTIKELCEEGIKFISFGTNDLTQYILAVDRGNEAVQDLYNEMHPAVLRQLEYVIRVCKRFNVETSICGQAGSKKPMVKYLIEKGIDSISVNADVAKEISDYAKEIENSSIEGTDKEPRQYEIKKQEEKENERKE